MRRRQRGFTLIEVLVALLVFAIAVVGLVAIESRSIEAQKASVEIREAERIAQDVMAELQAKGFLELVEVDFAGNENPSFPYDDTNLDPADRIRDYRRPPADIDESDSVVGSVRGKYLIFREVDWIVDPITPPTNPPDLDTELGLIRGLTYDVTVMWIDDTNPAFPPPAGLRLCAGSVAGPYVGGCLDRTAIEPGGDDFLPFVSHVRLRTVRLNDAPVSNQGGTP